MLFETPGTSCSRRWARLRTSFSAFAASSSSQAWRNARRTEACRAGDRRSMMFLAALDRCVAPEAAPDRLGERLRAVDDKQTRHRWIEAPLDQVVDQCLHHGAVLGCPLHQSERVLEPRAVDPERRHQHKVLADVDAVHL